MTTPISHLDERLIRPGDNASHPDDSKGVTPTTTPPDLVGDEVTSTTSLDPLDELAAALARIAAHLDAAADALRVEHRAGVEAVVAAFDPASADRPQEPRCHG